jgi:hypothetical protein
MASNTAAFRSVRPEAPEGRRLHREQRNDLEEMILDHIAQAAGRLVEPPRPFTPKSSASVTCTLAT